MEHFVVDLYRFLTRRKWVVYTLMALWMGFVAVSIPRLRFVEDVFQTLPTDTGIAEYKEVLGSSIVARRTIVGFAATQEDEGDHAASEAVAFSEYADSLYGGSLLENVRYALDVDAFEQLANSALTRIPVLADSAGIARISALNEAEVDSTVRAVRMALAGQDALVRKPFLLGDPFGLLNTYFHKGLQGSDPGGVTMEGGQLVTTEGPRTFLVFLDQAPNADPLEVEAMYRVLAAYPEGHSGLQVSWFGPNVIALANKDRITADVRWTVALAMALILALLFWYYRKWTLPFLFLLPPVFGILTALSLLAWTDQRLSAIALGVAASLIGIGLDYSFHFFTHLRHSRSIEGTLKDITKPLLLGCGTTVLAFLGLRFLESGMLRDLGALAAWMLGAAAVFVLVILPHLLGRSWEEDGVVEVAQRPATERNSLMRWGAVVVVLITLVLVQFVGDVRFEDDPERVSYMPPEMARLRDQVLGTEDELRTLLIASTAPNSNTARMNLERTVERLRSVGDTAFRSLHSPTDLLPSPHSMAMRQAKWNAALPNDKRDSIAQWFRNASLENGFKVDAFGAFIQLMNDTVPTNEDAAFIQQMEAGVLPGMVQRTADGSFRWVAIARVPEEVIARAEGIIGSSEGVSLLHRGMLSTSIRQMVDNDLQRILWITSLLVFFTLWITSGRIEVAVITFLPMLLSWIWILGICGLFGISLNMVNIIICTFIFGLGDDYCIFTTSAILGRYRDGRDQLPTIRAAVVLSAVTTMIGTGVLLFAEHPALRSIALLSVIGMSAILFISLTVQPLLFRWAITTRATKGKFPFTLRSLLISAFSFLYFVVGCTVLMVLLPPVLLLPLSRVTKRAFYGRVIMLFTRSLVYVMLNVRKDVVDFRDQVEREPSIVIANHGSFVDILVMLMVHPRTIMMTNRWVWNSPFFGAVVRYMGFLRTEDPIEVNMERARDALQRGWSIVVFPEGTRSVDGRIGRFHKGAFHMAETLKAPIVPVLLHGVAYSMSKNDAMLKDGTITMRTLPAIAWDDPRFGTGPRERTRSIASYFRSEYRKLKEDRETPSYFREQMVRNYIYKGPVLEWYIRVKSKIDAALDELIHRSLPREGRIVDLGCGHGHLDLMLALSAPERSILAVDHDDEKIRLARNCFSVPEGLTFETADIEHFDMPPADAYLLRDVLHYLPQHQQRKLLGRMAEKLATGGRIIIRDGFVEHGSTHKRTEATEKWSLGLGFNKSKYDLEFMTREFLDETAKELGLVVSELDKGSITSNRLFMLSRGTT